MKQLSITSCSANNVSEKIEQLTMTKNDEIKKLTIELGKCKAELDFLSKNQNRAKSAKMNSFACQFDNDSCSSASSILDEKKLRQLKGKPQSRFPWTGNLCRKAESGSEKIS